MARKTSVYLSDELEAAVDAAGVGVGVLVRRGLDWEAVSIRQAAAEAVAAGRDDFWESIREVVRGEVRSALREMQGGSW